MTKRTVTLACLAGAFLTAPAQASCIPSDERQDLRRADAVFVGRVLSVRESDGSAMFRVRRVVKGRVTRGSRVRVYATPYPSSITIGWAPAAGQRWRLYVDRRDGRWETDDCMGTRRA